MDLWCSSLFSRRRGDSRWDFDSVVILIPKVTKFDQLTNFRCISLCSFLHKIYCKVLANILKVFITKIISKHQCDVLPGQLITNNALVSYEFLHINYQWSSSRILHTKLSSKVHPWSQGGRCHQNKGIIPLCISWMRKESSTLWSTCIKWLRSLSMSNTRLTSSHLHPKTSWDF
jgi:hypothetical protein